MKKLLLAISLLLFTNVATADWVHWDDPDIMYRSDCPEPESIVVVYHGANVGPDITEPEELGEGLMLVIDDLVSYCSLVIIPSADRHELRGQGSYQVWDFSDDFTHGMDAAEQQKIIQLAQAFWPDKPTYLLGGSAGAFMTYKLANDRRILGLPLDGLVMLDGASPYGVSADAYHARYADTDWDYRFTSLGLDYYTTRTRHMNLGFTTFRNEWDLDTLIVNSYFDQLVPANLKREFAVLLGLNASQLQVNWKGSHHDIGPEGIAVVRNWFMNRLSNGPIVHYATIF